MLISGFITKVGDWFKEKFELIKGIFENPLNFIKKIIDKVFVLIDGVKKVVSNVTSGVSKVVSFGKNFFARKPKESPVDDTAERR
jgi:phage-related protein